MNIRKYGKKPKKIVEKELFIKNWRPIEGWLIEDKNNTFVLPINHSTLGEKFFNSYKTSVKRSFLYLFLTALLVFAVLTFTSISQPVEHIIFFSMLFIFSSFDMGLSIKTFQNCKQKVEFLFEIHKSFKNTCLFFAPFFLLIWLIQLYASDKLGGLEPLVILFGNYYPEIDICSVWRFVIGPLLHGDINHWLINSVLTIIFASMLPTTKNILVFCLFYLGAVVSHITTFAIHSLYNTPFDSLLGVSGGAYTLLAYTISYYFHKKYLNVALSLFVLVIFTEISVSILSNNTSHSAHLSGLVIGFLAYAIKIQKYSSFPISRT
ncbi:rhomboid family intramembrane serine protease [Pseudoalteromonas sp.]|uniref:rhomboid family intramembrane serine protease n=1 Tax=Pseudoalteromonas sp. TaxID=53249 RepID=UPI00351283FB